MINTEKLTNNFDSQRYQSCRFYIVWRVFGPRGYVDIGNKLSAIDAINEAHVYFGNDWTEALCIYSDTLTQLLGNRGAK